jgi:hypothetical protein
MGGGCGRVAHLESLDVLKESCHVIKFHFSLKNCNLLFKFVHPEVGEWSYVRTLQGAFVEGDWKWRNKLDSTVLLFLSCHPSEREDLVSTLDNKEVLIVFSFGAAKMEVEKNH